MATVDMSSAPWICELTATKLRPLCPAPPSCHPFPLFTPTDDGLLDFVLSDCDDDDDDDW